jgi:hypothetical protein
MTEHNMKDLADFLWPDEARAAPRFYRHCPTCGDASETETICCSTAAAKPEWRLLRGFCAVRAAGAASMKTRPFPIIPRKTEHEAQRSIMRSRVQDCQCLLTYLRGYRSHQIQHMSRSDVASVLELMSLSTRCAGKAGEWTPGIWRSSESKCWASISKQAILTPQPFRITVAMWSWHLRSWST